MALASFDRRRTERLLEHAGAQDVRAQAGALLRLADVAARRLRQRAHQLIRPPETHQILQRLDGLAHDMREFDSSVQFAQLLEGLRHRDDDRADRPAAQPIVFESLQRAHPVWIADIQRLEGEVTNAASAVRRVSTTASRYLEAAAGYLAIHAAQQLTRGVDRSSVGRLRIALDARHELTAARDHLTGRFEGQAATQQVVEAWEHVDRVVGRLQGIQRSLRAPLQPQMPVPQPEVPATPQSEPSIVHIVQHPDETEKTPRSHLAKAVPLKAASTSS